MNITQTVQTLIGNVKTYWKRPPEGRQMTFREIAAYSGGGCGAYLIITLGTACLLATNNTLISSTLGVQATHMYIMYAIAVLANIPLTGIRANIIDNTRNKAGKYRPYIVSMAIPTAIICIAMVWFPYNKLESIVGTGMIFGETRAYVAKCAIIMILNFLLHFFYYFFYDSYDNLIHVLSSNSQERADVASVKSIVYSFAPTVVNLITPIIAQNIFHTNTTDIRVYRLLYPIIGVLGILLCVVVYKYTEEKIVQARTHVIQIRFTDALREVAKNKYFWIISLAGWLGFLESAFANILFWLYNYGGACSGTGYGFITFIYGNASLWGMLLAPFCIRKWGKKAVLVVTNIFNVVFILMMLPFTAQIGKATIWLVLICLYFNAFMGSFAHILNPSIQADIRDYQQYKSGERIDGMFSAVATIGTVIALLTSSVLPVIYEKGGITKENAAVVTSNPAVLGRMLGDGKSVGQILAEQLASGQDNYINPYSALYDMDILTSLLHVLIIVSAIGAVMNVLPYFWYDFNEKKQKSVVRVLKCRALFEDYGNGALNDEQIVEAIDLVRDARKMSAESPVVADKSSYKSIKDKAERKAAKKAYKEALDFNEEIEIAQFVCKELDKFSSPVMQYELENSRKIYEAGLDALKNMDIEAVESELKEARRMPKGDAEAKELRTYCITTAKNKKRACKAIAKYYSEGEFIKPDYQTLENCFAQEDGLNEKLKTLYNELHEAKAQKDRDRAYALKSEIKALTVKRDLARTASKKEMDTHVYFARAAKPYLDAEKMIKQADNYRHYDEIADMYDDAAKRAEAARAARDAEIKRLEDEDKAYKAKLKAEKLAKKEAKKNGKK